MFELVFPLSIGFIGSLHCLGMCGPLVLAYSLTLRSSPHLATLPTGRRWREGLKHHLAFHLGRLLTYGLLGAAAAGLVQVADLSRFYHRFHNPMMILGGVGLLLLGLLILQVIPLPAWLLTWIAAPGSSLQRRLAALVHSPQPASKVLLGLGAGLLPCYLSMAMVITAAASGEVAKGFAVMFLFGTGTVPALLVPGLSASMVSLRIRLLGERVAALSIMVTGVLLVLRGAGVLAC